LNKVSAQAGVERATAAVKAAPASMRKVMSTPLVYALR
jgi:hypothetical protein